WCSDLCSTDLRRASGAASTPRGEGAGGRLFSPPRDKAKESKPGSGGDGFAVDDGGRGAFGEGDDFPGRLLGHQRAHQLVVERVPGLEALERPQDRMPRQVQVPDRIEDLVAHELV